MVHPQGSARGMEDGVVVHQFASVSPGSINLGLRTYNLYMQWWTVENCLTQIMVMLGFLQLHLGE